MLLSAYQVEKLLNAFVRVNNASATGGSITVTSGITTALSTAGEGGVAVPLQVASATQIGVVAPGVVPLFANSTKKPLTDANGNEVYGKLTEASGVYTLTFYSNVNGTETAYSFSAATAIDYLISYKYDLGRYPSDAATAYPVGDINIAAQSGSTIPRWYNEKLNVTASNVVSSLSKLPQSATTVFLIVNGKVENAFGGASAAFSMNNKDITWSATNAKYSLTTSHEVIAFYGSLE
ncbi:MAG: hypothetical protein KME46_32405 [Brasilonema angustatum HA4187-MV1]|jgi:hypothetical protein|nr:hypothetical protein [Brasilonema angustatum HA4187-MV1]